MNHQGVGINFGGTGTAEKNDITGFDWGICAIWGSYVDAGSEAGYEGRNNRITNCNFGLMVYRNSYGYFGTLANPGGGKNSIYNNVNYNAAVGYSYPTYPSWLWAEYDWWGSNPPNSNKFYTSPACTSYFWYPLSSDPWNGIPLSPMRETANNTSSQTISSYPRSNNFETKDSGALINSSEKLVV